MADKTKKTYWMSRKINLGKYGHQYEGLDFGIEAEGESFTDVEQEITAEKNRIHSLFTAKYQEKLQLLGQLPSLSPVQQLERENLKRLIKDESPF